MNDKLIKSEIQKLKDEYFEMVSKMDPLAGSDSSGNKSLIYRAERNLRKIGMYERTLEVRAQARKYHAWQ